MYVCVLGFVLSVLVLSTKPRDWLEKVFDAACFVTVGNVTYTQSVCVGADCTEVSGADMEANHHD